MTYVFFGTPLFAVRVLSKLVTAGFMPLAVVTNPDRPVGRRKLISPSAVKSFILKEYPKKEVIILSPEKLDEVFINDLRSLEVDFFIVAAYGKLISHEILAMPVLGALGVHPSLLPKYRGASPIQSALIAGEHETGVSLYFLNEKMDAGPIIARVIVPIQTDETYETLAEKLAIAGGELLIKILPDLKSAKLSAEAQDETLATYTKKFSSEDGYIDPVNLRGAQNGVNLAKDYAVDIYRKIQALNPEPGVWTIQNGKRVKLLKSKLAGDKLKLTATQIEGKKSRYINDS